MQTASLAAILLVAVGAKGTGEPGAPAQLHELEATVSKQGARVQELEATVSKQSAQLLQQQAQVNELTKALQDVLLVSKRGGDTGRDTTTSTLVDAAGRSAQLVARGRRLSAGSGEGTAVGTRAWQTHVFPTGHSCPNLDDGQVKMLLPVTNRSEVTWNPVPADLPADANVSLRSVASDWSTAEIQTFPAPFRIVHDATCTATPTLELPLDTTVHGALTIASATGAGAGPTWTDLAAALQVAMGFETVGTGACSGTATFTATALMHGEAAGSPTLDPPGLSLLTWARRAFQTCTQATSASHTCKYVSVNTDGSYSAFSSGECASRTGTDAATATAMTFELALSGYVKYDNTACTGRNEILSATTGYTYVECQAVCDADATCRSFEFTPGGQCAASTSCVFEEGGQSSNYQLHVKIGK